MKPKISVITLGVSDLKASLKFYCEGLGFEAFGDTRDIGILKLEGTWLSLYPRELLAKDANVSAEGSGFHGFTIAHNVKSKEEVNEVLDLAVKSGAKLVKPGQDAFWGGYSGYFSDPDGFLWEVAWNPLVDLV
ncbi:MAG TPA: VOC family protein [Candidatus Paceibacterota bacterium]|nr:VOC family protein [Candidatus Paceibacterota bacterium]